MKMYNYYNKQEIDNIIVHDSEFYGFSYDYMDKKLQFSCDNYWILKKKQTFIFHNVILCNLQGCSFWHGGNCILGLSLLDNAPEMSRLKEMSLEFEETLFDDKTEYITLELQLNSGDTLLIIFESLEYYEEKLKNKN